MPRTQGQPPARSNWDAAIGWSSMRLRYPTAIAHVCMYLEKLLEVRIMRQFNIRSVEILALHWAIGN